MAQDQGLDSKIEEILSLMTDMASKSNLSRSEPRYEEMLSLLKRLREKLLNKRARNAQKSYKKRSPGQVKAERRAMMTRGKKGQLLSTSQSEKSGEDGQGKEDYELSGPQRSKKNETSRENEEKIKKKKASKDEGQKQNEREDERKRKTQKRAREEKSKQGAL